MEPGGNKKIDYIAVPMNRSWVTNAQTKGVANPNSAIQHANLKMVIKYDIVRTNNQARNRKHVRFDIKQIRENATQLQRGPNETRNIQKLIQTRAIYYKINKNNQHA